MKIMPHWEYRAFRGVLNFLFHIAHPVIRVRGRENLPQGVSPEIFNLTALSADEKRTPAVMGKLLSLGADAYATGGQGNIRITVFPSGKIFAERVD